MKDTRLCIPEGERLFFADVNMTIKQGEYGGWTVADLNDDRPGSHFMDVMDAIDYVHEQMEEI